MLDPDIHTFVVCAYKDSPYLGECIKSLQAQTVPTNIIVATSTPTEGSRGVCNSLGVRLVERDGDSGLANDWNFAVRIASTPLVTLAHQDDVYKPDYAETMLKELEGARKPLMFFSNYGELRNGEEIDDNRNLRVKRHLLRRMSKVRVSDNPAIKRSAICFGDAICCPSVTLVKANIPIPLFKQGLSSNLDWEAWELLSRRDGSFVYSSNLLMLHRVHEGSETTRIIGDGDRTKEDLEMLKLFWPSSIAHIINIFYKLAQKSNG